MISTDTLEDNTAFAKKERADFPILADPSKDVATRYGVLRNLVGLGSIANRWTYYIGPDGRILYIDKSVKASTAGDDAVARLQELKVPPRQDR
jgi:peroxiredoxin Q/BCP